MREETHRIRGLNFHVQLWGDSSKPLIFMLHGWMDCGASYKFVAEYLQDDFYLVAPDLRGYGRTDHAPGGYWFPDYFADLEKLLDIYAPARPANLVGHSMGGNIVLHYAGIHPQRVNRVLSLEALGIRPSSPNDATQKYRQWMREILSDEPSKIYPNIELLKHSIYKGNPSLNAEMIDELVELWAEPVEDGNVNGAYRLRHDHAHRYTNPARYNFEDTLAIWQEVSARVGVVMAADSPMYHQLKQFGRIEQKVADQDYTLLEHSSHMLHLEQPAATAECIRRFFS